MEQNDVKKIVAEHLSAGVPLTEIQNILAGKHGVKMKFLELRLMASELENIDWTKLNKKEEKKPEAPAKAETLPGENENDDNAADEDFPEEDEAADENMPEEKGVIQGKTTVELSKVVRPGAVACGSVKFGSGVTAEWVLDQLGRLGLEKASGKPTQRDVKDFQVELQKLLR